MQGAGACDCGAQVMDQAIHRARLRALRRQDVMGPKLANLPGIDQDVTCDAAHEYDELFEQLHEFGQVADRVRRWLEIVGPRPASPVQPDGRDARATRSFDGSTLTDLPK